MGAPTVTTLCHVAIVTKKLIRVWVTLTPDISQGPMRPSSFTVIDSAAIDVVD